MNLEIDIGNTFLKWRLISEQNIVEKGTVLTKEFALSDFMSLEGYPVKHVFVGSVAGSERGRQLENVCQQLWQLDPVFARTSVQCAGVANSYKDPSKMGVDRWLAMIAAYKKVNKAVMVVDCGSAITVDYVSDRGRHQGGYIIPGLRLMRESLLHNTAQVRFEKGHTEIKMLPGVNTAEAVLHGTAYLFKALAHELRRDVANDMDMFFTGGDGVLMHELVGAGRLEPDLVMDGLVWVCI